MDQIPTATNRIKPRPDYDEDRKMLREVYPMQACLVGHGMEKKTARNVTAALNHGDFFACIRSVNLPQGVEPFAVYAGWCLSEEEIQKAKGKS